MEMSPSESVAGACYGPIMSLTLSWSGKEEEEMDASSLPLTLSAPAAMRHISGSSHVTVTQPRHIMPRRLTNRRCTITY